MLVQPRHLLLKAELPVQGARASPVSFREAASDRPLTPGRGVKRSADGDLDDAKGGGVRLPGTPAGALVEEAARMLARLGVADDGAARSGVLRHSVSVAYVLQNPNSQVAGHIACQGSLHWNHHTQALVELFMPAQGRQAWRKVLKQH